MPKLGQVKLIEGFLIPSLDACTFGDNLKWVNKKKMEFELIWNHKGGPAWTEKDAAVFTAWDALKGRFPTGKKTYYTDAKQRFRAALYKLPQILELPEPSKFVKKFRISLGEKNSKVKKNAKKDDDSMLIEVTKSAVKEMHIEVSSYRITEAKAGMISDTVSYIDIDEKYLFQLPVQDFSGNEATAVILPEQNFLETLPSPNSPDSTSLYPTISHQKEDKKDSDNCMNLMPFTQDDCNLDISMPFMDFLEVELDEYYNQFINTDPDE